MSNGRMTFRFDADTGRKNPEPPERRPGAGLGTAKEYAEREQRREAELLQQQGHPADSGPEIPQRENFKEPDGDYPGHFRQGQQEDGTGTAGDTRQFFFRPDRSPDLWEQSPRYPPAPLEEAEYGERSRGPEWTAEPGRYGSYGGSYHTRRPSYWWKLALSIAGALGTGILLGYAALSFIGGGSLTGNSAPPSVNSAAVQSETDTAAVLPPETGGNAAVTRVPVQVAAQTYYLLQYGVFSTPAGAEQARQELLVAGLAAGLDPADGNRVYAGMSPDREQAKLLSSGLKNQGIELYVREVTLPAAELAAYAGTAETVNSYFDASGKLLAELSRLSASHLSGQAGTVDSTAVSDLHMQWTEAVKALEPGLPIEAQKLCAGLEKFMSQGISALNEYNKNQAQGLLWEVQESMMSFLTGQKSLLSALS
ncbi:SPOR domain-containing protein [Paenibacillus sp. S150]|uniref:SPOR domain-containing protein n=1 Tax=Paenibacillus sp. S150 TaxID=2749826 RepID=UPI001C56AA5D|nr:SPOR domain-containing protein [Paenibacillus sp. S150]MBW4084723.1 SPOR domain-containing protein [Paenibacillus sp. S150]